MDTTELDTIAQTGQRYIMENRNEVQLQYRKKVQQTKQEIGTTAKIGIRYIMENRTWVHQKYGKSKIASNSSYRN